MRVLATFSVAALLLCAPAHAKYEAIYKITSGPWKGNAFKVAETGKFSHCAIGGTYGSGRRLIFMYTAKSRLALMVRDRTWELGNNRIYSAAIFIDSNSIGERTLRSLSSKSVLINFGSDDSVLERLRRGRVLAIRAPKRTFRFKLTGTAKALARIRECVRAGNADGSGTASSNRRTIANPFARDARPDRETKPASNSMSVPDDDGHDPGDGSGVSGTGRSQAARAPSTGETGRAKMRGTLRRILARAGVNNPKFFDAKAKFGLPKSAFGWTDDGVTGLHLAVRRTPGEPGATIREAFQSYSGTCGGEFEPEIGSPVTHRNFTIVYGVGRCHSGTDSLAVYVSAMLRKKSAFVFVHLGVGLKPVKAERQARRLNRALLELIRPKP